MPVKQRLQSERKNRYIFIYRDIYFWHEPNSESDPLRSKCVKEEEKYWYSTYITDDTRNNS